MDWLIDKIKLKLYKIYGIETGYKITENIWAAFAFIIVIITGYLTNNLIFSITFFIIFDVLRFFSGGYHCDSLNNCCLFTSLCIIIFGYISKSSLDYNWLIFIISLYSCKNILLKSPINETDFSDKYSPEWHKHKLSIIIFFILLLSIIFIYLNFILISNSILISIIMVDILLFDNNFE